MMSDSRFLMPDMEATSRQINHNPARFVECRDEFGNTYRSAVDIIAIFNQTFALTEQTILIAGGKEPVYYPAGCNENPGSYNKIIFTNDFVNSALHEIAHWCIAGKGRRQSIDYGYWYEPDGRTNEQQKLFTQVEIKPQALEWHFAAACGVKFHLSFDNLNGNENSRNGQIYTQFKRDVAAQALNYQRHGLPIRAEIFKTACFKFFKDC